MTMLYTLGYLGTHYFILVVSLFILQLNFLIFYVRHVLHEIDRDLKGSLFAKIFSRDYGLRAFPL